MTTLLFKSKNVKAESTMIPSNQLRVQLSLGPCDLPWKNYRTIFLGQRDRSRHPFQRNQRGGQTSVSYFPSLPSQSPAPFIVPPLLSLSPSSDLPCSFFFFLFCSPFIPSFSNISLFWQSHNPFKLKEKEKKNLQPSEESSFFYSHFVKQGNLPT